MVIEFYIVHNIYYSSLDSLYNIILMLLSASYQYSLIIRPHLLWQKMSGDIGAISWSYKPTLYHVIVLTF